MLQKLFSAFLHKRTAFFISVLTGALWVCWPHVCAAQRSAQKDVRSRVMERLEEEEAARLLAFFRAQRPAENFCFQFQLLHKPRRGNTVRYKGFMYGSYNGQGPVTRFRLFPEKVGNELPEGLSPIEMIVQNGPSPEVWVRHEDSAPFTLIQDDSLFEPIFEGVLYTPFDMQMPFIFWNRYFYEGPSRVLSRIGHNFLMFPPADSLAESNGLHAVRVAIDDTYYALLRAEVLQDDDQVRSRFTVRGIKKIQDNYIVKEIEIKNMITKDATTFRVKAACLGLKFADSIFDPVDPAELPETASIPFEVF